MNQLNPEAATGVIFDIQRYSVHDGPGLRTNVFFKGCPLRCGWCANPESQRRQPELALFETRCIKCGQYPIDCPQAWHDGREVISRDEYCERVNLCPVEGIRWLGQVRSAEEIMQEVRRDLPFYGEAGGLTLTGGEPTMQPYLAEALLKLAKAEGISTAMETCGHAPWANFKRLLPYMDHILFDIKHTDPHLHRTHTGAVNTLILNNLRQLAAIQAPLRIRVPLIPGFNADEDSLRTIGQLVLSLNLTGLDVLPYHVYGLVKYKALNRPYPWQNHTRLSAEQVDALAGVFRQMGLTVTVGG